MFERFTEKAVNVVSRAQEIAKEMNSASVQSEHLLLALCAEAKGVSLKIFRMYNITYEQLFNEISKVIELIEKIAKENNVEEIVVGVPLNMDNTKGFQADNCIEFSKKLEGFKIVYEDERLTSELAEENLKERKVNFRKDKGLVDVESARIILEQYLSKVTK